MIKIAILDDDQASLFLIRQALQRVTTPNWLPIELDLFNSGRSLLAQLRMTRYDVLILDRQLPDISGDEVLRWVRANLSSNVVVVMLSSLVNVQHTVSLLNEGADDYMTKPFDSTELVARIQRILLIRNPSLSLEKNLSNTQFTLYGVLFDRHALTVTMQSKVFRCTEREFALTAYFLRNVGVPLAREEVFAAVWQQPEYNSRALDALIFRLRVKFALDATSVFVISPIYKFGYRVDINPAALER